MSEKIQCNHCHGWKDPEEFNWRWKALGIRQPACKTCQAEQRKNSYKGDVRERQYAARDAARDYVYNYL